MLVCSELTDLHLHLGSLGTGPGSLEIDAVDLVLAASRLSWAKGGARLLLAEEALTLPPLQAQQSGNGGKL